MGYKGNTTISGGTIYGNPTGSPAEGTSIPLGPYVAFTRNQISATPGPGRDTAGDVSLFASDDGTSFVSTDISHTNFFLPTGLRRGFHVRSYQGSTGLINYIPMTGATLLNGSVTSSGVYSQGYYVDIENVGSDRWIIRHGTPVIDNWSIAGMPSIKEGDACTFIITRPAVAFSSPGGATIKVAGTGVSAAGLARTLVQTLTDLDTINPNVTFDGVDTLTILPGAINPIALSFYVVPTYTNLGNRDFTLTISDPSVGNLGTTSFTTTVLNVSKPTDPSELFPPVSATVASDAAGSQNQITVLDASNLVKLGTVTGSANIPALTWITTITGNVLTLSANLTGTVAATTVLTVTPPGIWFDFASGTGLTFDTSTSGSAGYFDVSGHLDTATLGTARFDYDPNTHASRGILYEDVSTNLVKQSVFSGWSSSNTAIALNNATSPDNASHAARFTDNTTSGTHFINGPTSDVAYAVGTTYTVSVFLKPGTETIAQLVFAPNNFAAGQYANFDLSGGVVASSSGVTAAIMSIGSGWYRCSITAACTTASTNSAGYISLTNTNSSATQLPSYAGTSKNIFGYGFQCETASTATSYIPTSGAQIIRPAGSLSFTVPGGCTSITVTFDDSSTQIISVSPGSYVLPVALTRPDIKTITGTSLSLDFTGGSLPPGASYTYGGNGLPVSSSTDKINGYPITQATTSLKPTFLAKAWNGIGGMLFNGNTQNLTTSTAAPLYALQNDALHHYTSLFVLKRNHPGPAVGTYGTFMGSCHNSRLYAHDAFPTTLESQAYEVAVCFTRWDGAGRSNSNPLFTYPMTLTADMVHGTNNATVDDSTSIGGALSAAFLQLNPFICCPVISSWNSTSNPRSQASSGPTNVNTQIAPGVTVPAGSTIYLTGDSISGTITSTQSNTSFQMGCVQFGTGPFTVLEFILVPQMLTPQQLRGVELYIANKWGASITTTVSSNVSPSTNLLLGPAWRVPISSLTGVCPGQGISATTGIAANTVVKGINSVSGNIEIDTPIQSPGISSGATLTLTSPSFKRPAYLDVNNYDLIYRDDFSTGFRQWNGTQGWTINEGSYYNYPFNNTVHGNVNFGTFYPDPSYAPWVPYDPFYFDKPVGAESGQLTIDLFPTPAPMVTALSSVGYTKSAVGGLPTNQSEFRIMHGYVEARMKIAAVKGAWHAFWMTATNDQPIFGAEWPPEFDIFETTHGDSFGGTASSLYSQSTFNSVGNNPFTISPCSDTFGPAWQEYILMGADITPTHIDIYVNREFIRRIPTMYDTAATFWCIDLDTNFVGTWDKATHAPIYFDYIAAWRKKPQSPSIPGGTQAETTALISAMTTTPDGTRQTLINTLIASLKTYQTGSGQSFWNALDFLYIPAAHDAQAGRIDWKNPAKIGTVVGSPTFQTDRGYTGNLSTSYIDTGMALATAGFNLTQSQNHIGSVINNVTGAPQSTSVGTVGSSQFFLQPTNTAQFVTRNLTSSNTDFQGNVYGAIIQIGLGPNTVPVGQTAANCHLLTTRNYYKMFPYVNGQYASGMSTNTAGQGNKTSANPQPALDTDNLLFANSNYQTACFHGGVFLTADDARDLYNLLYAYLHALGAL